MKRRNFFRSLAGLVSLSFISWQQDPEPHTVPKLFRIEGFHDIFSKSPFEGKHFMIRNGISNFEIEVGDLVAPKTYKNKFPIPIAKVISINGNMIEVEGLDYIDRLYLLPGALWHKVGKI